MSQEVAKCLVKRAGWQLRDGLKKAGRTGKGAKEIIISLGVVGLRLALAWLGGSTGQLCKPLRHRVHRTRYLDGLTGHLAGPSTLDA